MDVPRPGRKPRLWQRRPVWIALAAVLLTGIVVAGLRSNPGSLKVDKLGVSTGVVERGPLQVTVHGSGMLRASDVHLISAQSDARVERVAVQAGAQVQAGDLLVQLVNPALNQLAEETRWSLQEADAELNALRTQLDSEQLNQQATIAKAQYAAESARLQLTAEASLVKEGIVSRLSFQRSELNLKQLNETLTLERDRLQKGRANLRAQLAAREAVVSRLRKTLQRAEDQVAALSVRAPMAGTVQALELQPGQAVAVGAALAKLAKAGDLYAELQVQESQARDLAPGQAAKIDIRNALIPAEVLRVAPSVSNGTVRVDVKLRGELPKGTRPDLSVDGSIEVARIDNVLQVARPVFSQPDSPASVYRLGADGVAERLDVQFGTAAINRIVVKAGLVAGDRIVVSDTSSWRTHQRVSLR
ncbi:MAG: HlyD family efflux transporter periplasmic adaptor subunit [Chitinimonas sp.]|nr:HlyD family efflux transporter periplasmic adaptor subunit [Chitinimonas sp.]